MATESSRKRRRYGAELKAQILAECDTRGASVAKVALAYGINADIVRGWRKQAREADAVSVAEQFVPVAVSPVAPRPLDERAIEVELRRAAVTMKVKYAWLTRGASSTPSAQISQENTVVRDSDANRLNDQGAMLSPDEMEELEAALAEDQTGEVISGEEFLHKLRAPLTRSGSS